jgi:hypothetical protein
LAVGAEADTGGLPEPPVMLSARMKMHPRAAVMSMGYGMGLMGMQPSLRLVLGGSDAIHKVAGGLLDGVMPDVVARLAESAGLHFIDNVICDIRDDGHDVKFVLPANHGLPLAETHAVLVDINKYSVTMPLPLNRFMRRTVPRSTCQRLHAALCPHAPRVVLRPAASYAPTLAGPPLGPTGNPAGHAGPTPGPPDASKAHPAPPGRGEGRTTRAENSIITVVSCVETATGYAVELTVSGGGEVSGLSITPPYQPGGPATHSVKIALARPAGAVCEIRTVYPVDVRHARLKLSRKQRLITAELPKSEVWPVDVALPGMVPKLCADDLGAGWSEIDLQMALMMMFTNTELERTHKGFDASGIG